MIWEERVQVNWMIKWQIVQLYCKINFERIVNSLFFTAFRGEKYIANFIGKNQYLALQINAIKFLARGNLF